MGPAGHATHVDEERKLQNIFKFHIYFIMEAVARAMHGGGEAGTAPMVAIVDDVHAIGDGPILRKVRYPAEIYSQ